MRTPVSRFEKIAAYFILLTLIPLLALLLIPALEPGGFLHPNLFVFYVIADSGQDLAAGDKVTMSGIQIGEVNGLEFRKEDNRVKVSCSVYLPYRDKITTGAVPVIVPPPVVGSAKIDIKPGTGEPLTARPNGDPPEVEAVLEPSIEDRANEILVQVGSVIRNANTRVEELQKTLIALQTVLDQVNEGKGTLGRFIYEEDFYARLSELVSRLESSATTVAQFHDPIVVLAESLPVLTRTAIEAATKLDGALSDLQKGMTRFPETTAKLVIALDEGRRVLESLKRNFLIRPYLPQDAAPDGMAPVTSRDPLP